MKMKKENIEISIIIVQYKVKVILHECLRSVITCTKNVNYEIIVVDNDDSKHIKKDLLKEFPQVIYVANKNNGFGEGNNVGVTYAKGKYVFFLNPDTIISPNTVESLYTYLEKNQDVGIAAPLLMHEDKKLFDLQGLGLLTPLRGIIALSFINKLFPHNKISKDYWRPEWDRTKVKEVDAVPGTAFMMRRDLYNSIGGFDDTFFLYFEEFDLCKRVKDLGYKLVMLPQAKIIHLWGKSTAHRNDINEVFQQSRFYFFKKHYGVFNAFIVELILRMSKEAFFILLLLFISFIFQVKEVAHDAIFIGDQAWFYLSSRDLLLMKEFPLVGITSSHTWLHQGPLWTYILAFILWFARFNPYFVTYFSLLCSFITTLILYFIGKKIFSKQIAMIASVLYALSPLIIQLNRMPYHTTLIPLFTIIYFYCLSEWIKGKKGYFIGCFFLLGILYNLELATVILVTPLLLFLIYGIINKKEWIVSLTKRDFKHTLLFTTIPMLPVIIYDVSHGFKQTIVYAGWLVFNALRGVSSLFQHSSSQGSVTATLVFILERIQWLIFLPNYLIAVVCFFILLIFLVIKLFLEVKNHKVSSSTILLVMWLFIPLLMILGNKTPSDAYLPLLFPAIFYGFGVLIGSLRGKVIYVSALITILVVILNISTLLEHNYSITGVKNISLGDEQKAASSMINQSHGRDFAITGRGEGSQFRSYIMPYEYFVWYLGRPVNPKSRLVFQVEQKDSQIKITKYDK
ncbi:hypothetical protein BH09PAT1_BH09PAT1_3920 [soil metagenome]